MDRSVLGTNLINVATYVGGYFDIGASGEACGIYVGGTGNLAVQDQNGAEVIFQNVSGFLPISPAKIKQTGTTATNIIVCK